MLDGIYLYLLAKELRRCIGYRVDRIHQPLKEELILALRGPGESCKLLVSAHAAAPRILIAQETPDNPAEPPMFCMLMRKHLGNAKLVAIRQQGLDRIFYLDFASRNEFGDEVTLTLAVEIMGRHSNIILVGPDGRIIDAVKRIGEEMSSVRQVLPGMTYTLPPAREKIRVTESDADAVLSKLTPVDRTLSSVLFDLVEGMGPLTAREAAFRATGEDPALTAMDDAGFDRLRAFLEEWIGRIRAGEAEPILLCEPDGTPKEFCYMEIRQYGTALTLQHCDSLSQAIEVYYHRRAATDRMKQRAGEMVRQIGVIRDRIQRRLLNQQEELMRCADREELRVKADLINANLHRIQKGETSVTLENFYDPELTPITVTLDPRLTPQKNAQKYYAEYRKAATAEAMLGDLIAQGKQEAAYIETVADSLARATTIREVSEIRRELGEQGYLRRAPQSKGKAPAGPTPDLYLSHDGIAIRVGKNNLQNDRLTFKQARGEDIWLHAKDIPGSHVVISTEGIDEVPDATLEAAALLAAFHSRAEEGTLVPVDYTRIKYVKKQPGGKPGQVFYKQFKTVFVTPTEAAVTKAATRKH